MLRVLAEEYDPIGNSKSGSVLIMELKQGAKTLSKHHEYVTQLMRSMGRDMSTRDEMVIGAYCKSLRDQSLRVKLMGKWETKPMSTLQDMMKLAKSIERTRQLATGIADTWQEQQQAVPAAAAAVDCIAAGVSDMKLRGSPRGGRNQNGQQGNCPIHPRGKHDYENCRRKMATECFHCKETVEAGTLAAHITQKCKGPVCFYCHQTGHRAFQCHDRLRDQAQGKSGAEPPAPRKNSENKKTDTEGVTPKKLKLAAVAEQTEDSE